MSAAFLELLVHPIYKTPLFFDAVQHVMTDTTTSDRFEIKDGVPILLTSTLHSNLNTSALHERAGTTFRYKEHYQNDAVAYDYTEESENKIEREEIHRLRENILAEIPDDAEWILDVGCGGAWLAKTLVPQERKLISMDISDINPIRALKQVSGGSHSALVADVFELPFRPGAIDCIVASEIIEHVPDPKSFLSALFTVLKPGGKLIVTTPYNEFIRTSLCIHCNQLTPHNAHLHSFTEDKMQRILPGKAREVGMKVFNNKVLVKTHLQYLLRFLPLSFFNALDNFVNILTGKKAYRLMVTLKK